MVTKLLFLYISFRVDFVLVKIFVLRNVKVLPCLTRNKGKAIRALLPFLVLSGIKEINVYLSPSCTLHSICSFQMQGCLFSKGKTDPGLLSTAIQARSTGIGRKSGRSHLS